MKIKICLVCCSLSLISFCDTLSLDLTNNNWLVNDPNFGLMFPSDVLFNMEDGFYKMQTENQISYGFLKENIPIGTWCNYSKFTQKKIADIIYLSKSNFADNYLAIQYDSVGNVSRKYQITDFLEYNELVLAEGKEVSITVLNSEKQVYSSHIDSYKSEILVYQEIYSGYDGTKSIKWFNDKGGIIQSKNWKNGLKDGVWLYYDIEGVIMCKEYYQMDSLYLMQLAIGKQYKNNGKKIEINEILKDQNIKFTGTINHYAKVDEWLFFDTKTNKLIGKTLHDEKGNLTSSYGLFTDFCEW